MREIIILFEVYPQLFQLSTRIVRQPRYARLEKRSRRDGLVVHAVVAEAREHVPQVRRDHGHPREERGLFQRMRGEAAPSPLVLHLVENVLAVAAFAVERKDVPRVHVEVGDERVPLVAVRVVFVRRLHEFEAGNLQLRELPLRRVLPFLLGR